MDFDSYHPHPSPVRRFVARWSIRASRHLLLRRNRLHVHHGERLLQALDHPRGLLTFSNHVALFDDPWLPSCLVPVDTPWERIRWCATDDVNFFSNPVMAWFFSAGKGVPIVRGAGLDQPGMHFLAERLDAGDWVHIFPEGGRSRDPHNLRRPFKTGMAHLVKRCRPRLLPYHHWGMEAVYPIGARFPKGGNDVQLRVGEVTDSDEGLADGSVEAITEWAEARLLELEADARRDASPVDRLHRDDDRTGTP